MQKSKDITAKRLKSRYLIAIKGYSQKEAAKVVGVSYKTMCNWVARFNWKDATEKNINKKGGIDAIMDGFFEYVRDNTNAAESNKINQLWSNYKLRLSLEFE